MPTSPPASSNEALEEARFRARMARASSGTVGAVSRVRKDIAEGEGSGRGFRLGWLSWLVIDTLVILGTVAAVLAWPPIQACRTQDRTVGFYVGDSVDKCIRRGITERISNADQRIKMLMRGSGR